MTKVRETLSFPNVALDSLSNCRMKLSNIIRVRMCVTINFWCVARLTIKESRLWSWERTHRCIPTKINFLRSLVSCHRHRSRLSNRTALSNRRPMSWRSSSDLIESCFCHFCFPSSLCCSFFNETTEWRDPRTIPFFQVGQRQWTTNSLKMRNESE